MERKLVEGKPLFRAAEVLVSSANLEKRTVDVVFTTGFRGKREGWFGDAWMEELAVTPEAVRLERLNNGAPLLNNHSRWDLTSVMGVVERAWIAGDKGMATVRFSERADVEPLFRDVAGGIIRNVSVGYKVHRWEELPVKDNELPVMRAADWEPFEVSFVPIGFDPGAQARSADGVQSFQSEVIFNRSASSERNGGSMSAKANGAQAEVPAATVTPAVDEAKVRAEAAAAATAAERTRAAEIRDCVKKAKLPEAFGERMIADGTTVEMARKLVIDEWAKGGESERETRSLTRVEAGAQDENITRFEAARDAILHRADPARHKMTEVGRRFAGMNLREMAREFLQDQGISTRGMDPRTLATEALRVRAFHSTSDFPYALAAATGKVLLAGYEQIFQQQTFRPFVKIAYAPDFKQQQRIRVGEVPTLELVPEGAEVTRGTIGEAKEVYNLATYGKVFAITRESIINDDLGAFTDLPRKFGAAAARLESDIVWAILTANANMGDGHALFDATNHGNLTPSTGTAISVTSLGVARALMRKQQGINENDYLNITPKFLLVPPELETLAWQYTSANYVPAQGSNINPFAGTLQVISEPRLTDAYAWYLAASPADGVDTIELCYLDGQSGPQTETRVGFDVNGIEVKATLDVAAKALDWRGLYKNVGH